MTVGIIYYGLHHHAMLHRTTLCLMNPDEKGIIMGSPLKSYFVYRWHGKTNRKIKLNTLHSSLSWSCHSMWTLSLTGTTNVHSTRVCVADEWRNNGSPGGSHSPKLAQGLICPSLGHRSWEQSGRRIGGSGWGGPLM